MFSGVTGPVSYDKLVRGYVFACYPVLDSFDLRKGMDTLDLIETFPERDNVLIPSVVPVDFPTMNQTVNDDTAVGFPNALASCTVLEFHSDQYQQTTKLTVTIPRRKLDDIYDRQPLFCVFSYCITHATPNLRPIGQGVVPTVKLGGYVGYLLGSTICNVSRVDSNTIICGMVKFWGRVTGDLVLNVSFTCMESTYAAVYNFSAYCSVNFFRWQYAVALRSQLEVGPSNESEEAGEDDWTALGHPL